MSTGTDVGHVRGGVRVGWLQRLVDLDDRVLGRRARSVELRPVDRDARAVWEQLDAQGRGWVRQAALSGWVASEPHHALVVADLVDQLLERLRRSRRWFWLAMAVAAVGLVVGAVASGGTVSLWSLGGFVGGAIGMLVQDRRLDRVRRENLDVARAAGLR